MFSSIRNRLQRVGAKRLIIAAAFVAAMTAAAGLGLATKQSTRAASYDCDNNAILRCGAANAKEFINDAYTLNKSVKLQSDIQKVYASAPYGNLPVKEYDRFAQHAKNGYVDHKGNVVVGGKVVMSNAHSMGRQSFGNPDRKPVNIGGNTYYTSPVSVSFADGVKSLPVMVLFNDKGIAQSVIMNACGNPVWGDKPSYACDSLSAGKVSEDTYVFTTKAPVSRGATVTKVVYNFGDGTTKEAASPSTPITHKYTKNGTYKATVTVYFNLPGYGEVVVTAVHCAKQITVNVPQPYYACDMLTKTALNNEGSKYRFTVKARAGNGATIKDVDFTLDGKNTTTGVTQTDANGNIYMDYTFARDGATHEVVAKVNFNVASKVTSVTCKQSVKVGEKPVCPVPGKGHLPPDSPECVENCPVPGKEHLPKNSTECVENCPVEGKEHLPKDSTECEDTPPELPKTGMGSVLGLFAGTSAIGAVAHRVISNRRNG